MSRLIICIVAVLPILLAGPASAHKPSDSYLALTVAERQVQGRWDMALRDLEYAIGLDRDGDGAITWGEVRGRHADIAAYALARLDLMAAGEACPTTPTEHLIERHSDGTYAVLRFAAECPDEVSHLAVTYRFLFDLDSLHRGLVRVEAGELIHTGVLSPERRTWQVAVEAPDVRQQVVSYLREGIWHIWIGIDHILFLISLLLPAVLHRRPGGWQPVERFGEALMGVAKVVTAFTLAHSITLSLAALGVVNLPARLVESAIAASVVIAALNNLYPIVTRRLWLAAFGFGLLHGFGFASVLAGLGLSESALLLSLFSFNLGIELGQMAIVLVFMPVAYALRQSWLYPRVAVQLGSLLIVAIAAVWLIERAFGIAVVT